MKNNAYGVNPTFAHHAHITPEKYASMYQQSISDTEAFWDAQAKQVLHWFKPYDQVMVGDFVHADVRWFVGGELNASYNCLDRHLSTRAQQPAIIWEGDDPLDSRTLTYHDLHADVCRLANVLRDLGVQAGDRVCIYLPMIPEVVIAMLAVVRLGAIHSVVFAGFSAEALHARMVDLGCTLVITADAGQRGGKTIALKAQVDEALTHCESVRTVLVVKQADVIIPWDETRDHWYHTRMAKAASECAPVPMPATAPLFVLYTSGSTGKPKGIVHSTGGYLTYVGLSFYTLFDLQPNDIHWCTADVGWITGHSYSVYGPLLNGATTLIFAGVPTYPTPARCWEIIDKHRVTIFYTAPTAIRMLRREGDAWVQGTSRESLRLLGSVGEPINPEAWEWYYRVVGETRCPIIDTWWQTETGGIMMSPFPGATPMKAGAAAWPFFGVVPQVVDEHGAPVPDGHMGLLLITKPWPGLALGIYGNHARFVAAYFAAFPGNYLTGDYASRDTDGYYWIAGRSDDVIKVAGHRLGTQEIESALLLHAQVAEAAVVAIEDEIKGHRIYAYLTLKAGVTPSAPLKEAIIQNVRDAIGAIAAPSVLHFTEALPKTRSGKILRRLLRKIANKDVSELGDLSTLADATVIERLIVEREQMQER